MKWSLLVLTACVLAGCVHRETVALLPGADGKTGSLSVKSKEGLVRLDEAYAAADVRGESVLTVRLTQAEVSERFSAALDARPQEPVRFRLYFIEGSDRLTSESEQQIPRVFSEIKNRSAPDVQVVGHTDRVGIIFDNDRLALKRAEKIRGDLIQQGLDAENVVASGRGEREPLVVTDDEVPEPRNRRVELYVR
ncbi:OmpA family protein [Denitratisoma oestradiolicum]|uniref:OmpA/MotB domain-containing protein n=1 Tax=Denitratisoma oestradiolicum TaxID=311182 RepID=A0A6S6XTW9_9PROT|nr:OmpA family protein [Denitratisoma oestradiolicum]CAB1367387.1 OmpA/MotB domain-containing protein [Denitratisoma oestradiolicum]